MLFQHNLLLIENRQLQGFLSFRTPHYDARLPNITACIYVSTIAVFPAMRGHGYARLLYQELFKLPETLPAWILLRTWSTNSGHLRLLYSLGFTVVLTIPDDRGPGVDTLYLATMRDGRRRSVEGAEH
ncbi:MAG: GNAT family N-acetyltransferase [Pseudonocardiaceae bacterium]